MVTDTIPLERVISTLEVIQDWHNLDEGHSLRSARIACEIGRRLNGGERLNERRLQLLEWAAQVHDFGKTGVDNSVLAKSSRLTSSQRGAVEAHSQIGYDLTRKLELPAEISLTILHHHEHWDGSGYPKKLRGLDIPLFSRIICIADTWDGIFSARVYHAGRNTEKALQEINKSVTWFDPKLYTIFLEVLREGMT